jgi:hypothetical protein
MRSSAPPKYFVVASFSRPVEPRTHAEKVPMSQIHAQTWGSLRTVCGVPCESWTKWWDIPFTEVEQPSCRACQILTRDAATGLVETNASAPARKVQVEKR